MTQETISPSQQLYFDWTFKQLQKAVKYAPENHPDLFVIEKALQYKLDLKENYDIKLKMGVINWLERLWIKLTQGV